MTSQRVTAFARWVTLINSDRIEAMDPDEVNAYCVTNDDLVEWLGDIPVRDAILSHVAANATEMKFLRILSMLAPSTTVECLMGACHFLANDQEGAMKILSAYEGCYSLADTLMVGLRMSVPDGVLRSAFSYYPSAFLLGAEVSHG